MRPKTETKSKSLSVLAALTLLLMLFATTSVWAKDYNYISDLKLIGGTQAEVAALKTTYTEAEWEVIDQNLNEGAGGDYIYLLYKTGSLASANQTFVTKLYISTNKDADSFRSDDGSFTWSLVPYDGGTSFKSSKGNLNNGVGTYDPNTGGTISVGDHIHLYYTRQLAATISENMVSLTSITINNTSDGALGKNGNDAAAYSLNNGTTGNSIYIPPTKELLGGSLKRVVTVEDVALKRSIIVVMES